jgi:LPXTG-motif cell wall-anchored protein
MIRTLIVALLAVVFAAACASNPPEPEPEPEQVEVADVKPPPPPPAEVEVTEVKQVEELPKTASPVPLVGLAGLVAVGLGAGLRVMRRRL